MYLGSLAPRLALPGALAGICLARAILPTTQHERVRVRGEWLGPPVVRVEHRVYGIEVGGTGDKVWLLQGTWTGAGTVCNYKLQVRWSNNSGRVYETDNSPEHYGCRGGAAGLRTSVLATPSRGITKES